MAVWLGVLILLVTVATVCGDSCDLTGKFHENGSTDVYDLKQKDQGTVHIISEMLAWDSLDARMWMDASGVHLTAKFSNAGKEITAKVAEDCSTIQWSNGHVWLAGSGTHGAPITSIHLVYMTHLDLGFTDTTRNVCDVYFNTFFPQAFQTASELRARGGKEQFRWTEFPWLIQEYLDSGASCAHHNRTASEISAMENAIANNDVIWHASAVNFLPEVLDEPLWEYSLGMMRRLNKRYNKTWGALAGKHTDTPGMSKSAIPALARAGVKAYHIGYNSACAKNVKSLPPAFRWKHEDTHTELLTMVNNNYGSQITIGNDTVAMYTHGIKNAEHIALVFQFTGDNGGLPTASGVIKFWETLQSKYPKATIQASSIDDFYKEVIAKGDLASLPVITGELGDSWLYGAPADPIKVATFREARRALQEAITSKPPLVDTASAEYDRYMRRLMKGPAEHNWGLSINHEGWKGDWDNVPFHKRDKTDSDFAQHEVEWKAQREWNHACTPQTSHSAMTPLTCNSSDPASALPTSASFESFVAGLERRLQPLMHPAMALPDVGHIGAALSPQEVEAMKPASCGGIEIAFSGKDGSIRYLGDTKVSVPWLSGSDKAKTMAAYKYQTYGADNFEVFKKEYTASGDFMKQGMENSKALNKTWETTLLRGYQKQGASGCTFVMQLTMADPSAWIDFGAARNVSIEYNVPGQNGAMADISLVWTRKTATRLAESFWLSFIPEAAPGAAWLMDIMGHPVSPLEVVPGGTAHIHAVGDGVTLLQKGGAKLRVQTLDTPLLSPGDIDHMLQYNDDKPDVHGGMHFNLHNNLWGTAFPQWYGDDGLARFSLWSEAAPVDVIV